MQNLTLFYESLDQYNEDSSIYIHLQNLVGPRNLERFNVLDHKNSYNHYELPEYLPTTDIKMPTRCWCSIPDSSNPIWPKLHGGAEHTFIAAGQDILKLTESNLREYNES